ncbi:MAG: adenylate/guanylate cyclase domain-containing protein [Spirochaetaceae bacterium]|nr:adenylate/guanylate cyclase domain-containing protein [Spirochaetaceae bacterium]
MCGVILIIGTLDYSAWEGDLIGLAQKEGFDECAIAQASNMEEAFSVFFENLPVLIIADTSVEGGRENLEMLKTEEMYRHIPVIVVTEEYQANLYERLYTYGVDRLLTYKELASGVLPIIAKPLLVSSALFQLQIMRSNELQEKTLFDFIRLDLLKPYVPRTIWNMVQKNAAAQKLEIKEQEMELTLTFGDIKGFTTVSQHLKPVNVIKFLNVAFDTVTKHVYANDGDIDKFIGDAFFAVFKEPANAIKAMVSIQRELAAIRDKHLQDGDIAVQFRIAVHSGTVIRGNVGGNGRFDNTLIGDAVNTTSRLEHESPLGDILISEAAALKAGLNMPRSEMLEFDLRGRDKAIYAFPYFENVKKGLIEERY